MSLKAFHIFFIILSMVLAFGFGLWEMYGYLHGGTELDLGLGVLSLVAGVGLIFYFKSVLRKLKDISYL